jgi:hypothetical protein
MRWIEITGYHIVISNEEKRLIQNIKDNKNKYKPSDEDLRNLQLCFNLVSRGILEKNKDFYSIRDY